MNRLVLLIPLLLSMLTCAVAQNDNWVFGYNAGIHFSEEGPIAIENLNIYQMEGSASFSFGSELAVYTDGIKIYNKDGIAIADSFDLKGGFSSTHSGLIIPSPGNQEDLYFLFLNDLSHADSIGTVSGLSFIELNVNSFINGETLDEVSTTELHPEGSEKFATTYHKNGTDYWLILRTQSEYISFLIDSFGIHPISSISSDVSLDGNLFNPSILSDFGQMKVNLEGNLIAAQFNIRDTLQIFNGKLEFIQFDNCTGEFGDIVVHNDTVKARWFYGIEFSNNASHILRSYMDAQTSHSYLIRQKIESLNDAIDTLYRSEVEIGGMQVGPDSNIYVVCKVPEVRSSVSRIINADAEFLNDVQFDSAVVQFDTGFPLFSLPNMIPIHPGQDGLVELGEDQFVDMQDFPITIDAFHPDILSYTWSDGSQNSSIDITEPGVYYLDVEYECFSCSDSITISTLEDRFDASGPCEIEFPLAFSPNGDNLNDDFGAMLNDACEAPESFILNIISRAGESVFKSSDPLDRWRGPNRIIHGAVYSYTCTYTLNGTSHAIQGDVTLIY